MATEKEKLYRFVDNLREQLHIPSFCFTVNSLDLCRDIDRIDIEYANLHSRGLCGLAMLGDKIDTIILNKQRSKEEQNFDCAHELIHVTHHRGRSSCFNCFSEVRPQQDSFIEWQANEGAAQLLVPYQDFIPRFLRDFDFRKVFGDFDIIGTLAFHYGVTPQVIRNRIECLSYEMDQYRHGIDLPFLQFLSKNQRNKLNINPTNYLALCEFPLDWDSEIG